jgi:hypothetical protein
MPELNFISFSLGLELVFGVRNAGGEARRVNRGGAERATTWSSQVDTKEADLSPIAQRMQKQARKQANQRHAKEREADAESLYLLEAATAANSVLAKIKDRESLELLLRWTSRLAKYGKSLKTPIRTSFWPPARHFKGMNGTQLSFEPPFSTPEEVRKIYEEDTGNEFEDFLAKNRALSKRVESKPKRNSFTALLESAKSSSTKPTGNATEQSQYMKDQVQSFFDLIDKVEKQDLEEEMALTRDLAEAMDSPIPSPTASIKHLPRDSATLDAKKGMGESDGYLADLSDEGETRSENSDNGGKGNWDTGEDEDAAEAPATPESDSNGASDDDDWEVV